ncbi:CLOCK-interacting pacemaker-like [Cyprinus carpio]|uniref:CLOCK-interacting pacemaker-like n=1 Tax=Cyprinus carpio TaxID=7962 RepID=A0A9Q9Y281_CYPCA|nr:CLOCK-interacting pacemaker-like [Cyprinus carpio]
MICCVLFQAHTEEQDELEAEGRRFAREPCPDSKTKRMEKSKPESERDSGFSDGGSEHLSVDRDEASSSRSQLTLQGPLTSDPHEQTCFLKQPVGPFGPRWFPHRTQVVFLQTRRPQRSAPVPKGPPSKRHRHRKYLPILKSYPKIARLIPGKEERARSSKEPARATPSPHRRSPPQTLPSDAPHSVNTDNKIFVKRFCNTYNILSKSGLLDITLRTKELIRENHGVRGTQTELDLLREHHQKPVHARRCRPEDTSVIWSQRTDQHAKRRSARERHGQSARSQ